MNKCGPTLATSVVSSAVAMSGTYNTPAVLATSTTSTTSPTPLAPVTPTTSAMSTTPTFSTSALDGSNSVWPIGGIPPSLRHVIRECGDVAYDGLRFPRFDYATLNNVGWLGDTLTRLSLSLISVGHFNDTFLRFDLFLRAFFPKCPRLHSHSLDNRMAIHHAMWGSASPLPRLSQPPWFTLCENDHVQYRFDRVLPMYHIVATWPRVSMSPPPVSCFPIAAFIRFEEEVFFNFFVVYIDFLRQWPPMPLPMPSPGDVAAALAAEVPPDASDRSLVML